MAGQMRGCDRQSQATPAANTFHRRALPGPAIEFSSLDGQRMFKEALEAGTMGGFFRLIEQFHTQVEPAFCGLGTLTMVLNAMNVDPGKTWKGPWRWYHEGMLDCCEPLEKVKEKGIIWPKFLCLARCNGVYVEAYRASDPGGDIDTFRRLVCSAHCGECGSASEGGSLKALVVSYSRKHFGQTGDGHYSPIGGYHAKSDSILVLDVARFKHAPHWVPLADMHAAMLRVDADTGFSRGFALLTRKNEHGGWLSLQLRPTASKSSSCCPTASSSEWTWDLLESKMFKPIESCLKEFSGLSAAAEVLQIVINFCEHLEMPLTVVCQRLCNDVSTKASSDCTEMDPLQIESEQCARRETLDALREVAGKFRTLVGGCAYEESTDSSVCCSSPERELNGVELRTALVLSLDTSLWTRALCPEMMPRATPQCDVERKGQSVGAEVWALLQPLLDIEGLPLILRGQVATLRAQCLDLLTFQLDCQ